MSQVTNKTVLTEVFITLKVKGQVKQNGFDSPLGGLGQS